LFLTKGLSPLVYFDFTGKDCLPPSLGGTYEVIPCDDPIIIPLSLFYIGLAEPPLFGTSDFYEEDGFI